MHAMTQTNCTICERRCRIGEDLNGHCGCYDAIDGHLMERYPDRYLVACPISIETMPILHFRPGAKFLQISTTGCNFDCPGCISTALVREMAPDSRALKHLAPEQVIGLAMDHGCQGIVFLMNDPLAALPRFLRIAERANARGLSVGCSTNAYFTPESLTRLMPFLSFVNVGMKGFSDDAYRACGASSIRPILRNLAAMHAAGIHIEVSCILTRRNEAELMDLTRHIRSLSPTIPLQVMRFLPFESAAIDHEPSIRQAEHFCRSLTGLLDYVYLFNTPGSDLLDTRCPRCGRIFLHREFYGPMGARIRVPPGGLPDADRCPGCSHRLSIVGPPAAVDYREGDFEGGYPLTRAMEMVAAMLITMGVTHPARIVRAWEDLLQDGGLRRLHQVIQHPRTYIRAVRDLGRQVGVADRGDVLADFLDNRLAALEANLAPVKRRPRVYYAMGKPLFYINGGRMENQLVEAAGGISLNKQLPPADGPGAIFPSAGSIR